MDSHKNLAADTMEQGTLPALGKPTKPPSEVKNFSS